jgi:hypothetical protein
LAGVETILADTLSCIVFWDGFGDVLLARGRLVVSWVSECGNETG